MKKQCGGLNWGNGVEKCPLYRDAIEFIRKNTHQALNFSIYLNDNETSYYRNKDNSLRLDDICHITQRF
jgi:hypothetical protein